MVHDPGTLKLVPVEIGELGKSPSQAFRSAVRGAPSSTVVKHKKPVLLQQHGATNHLSTHTPASSSPHTLYVGDGSGVF